MGKDKSNETREISFEQARTKNNASPFDDGTAPSDLITNTEEKDTGKKSDFSFDLNPDEIDPLFSYYPRAVEDALSFYAGTDKKPALLLHVCCAPCASGVLDAITGVFDVTLFFYNPCIMPKDEFIRRLEAINLLLTHYPNVKLIAPEQLEQDFIDISKGLESCPEGGERCRRCFIQRLSKTADHLLKNKSLYDFYATTLTVSPHKNAALINEIGHSIAQERGVRYLSSDFKKRNGFLNSINNSKKLGLYRQSYCGCLFSKK